MGAFSEALSTKIGKKESQQPCEKKGRKKVTRELQEIPGRSKSVGGCPYNDSEIGDPGYRSARIDASRDLRAWNFPMDTLLVPKGTVADFFVVFVLFCIYFDKFVSKLYHISGKLVQIGFKLFCWWFGDEILIRRMAEYGKCCLVSRSFAARAGARKFVLKVGHHPHGCAFGAAPLGLALERLPTCWESKKGTCTNTSS